MKALDKLGWLLRRVSVMSLPEILHHVHRGLLDRIAARFRPGGPLARPFREAGQLDGLLDPLRPQLFRPRVQRSPEWDRRLLAGEAKVFGEWVTVDRGAGTWHTDPLTGAIWPKMPYARIDYRPGNPTGDVRIAWEINRLQHLFLLGDLAAEDDSRRAAAVALFERHLASWDAANPFGVGINFISAMEEALRLIAVLHGYDLVRAWVSPETRDRVARLVLSHGHHIERRLSLYSSAGNHTIAEAVGLLYAGIVAPECASAARWYARGRELLAAESARQVDADGGGIEQAPWYLLFICELLGLAQALLRHAGRPGMPQVDAAVLRARGFLNTLAWNAASLPRIGDADDGYALAAGLQMTWDDQVPERVIRTFSSTGVSVVRHGKADRLLFLHKPLGMPPNFAHGHADALSVLFRWKGEEIIVDPGTYSYGREPALRRYFRSTAAHNTVTVGDRDQAEQSGPFMWRHPFHSRLLIKRDNQDSCIYLAVNDGYRDQGYLHTRGVAYRFGEFLAVWDRLSGPGTDRCETHWSFGCPVEAAGTNGLSCGLNLQNGSRLALEISPGSGTGLCGKMRVGQGWQSGSYGRVSSADTIAVVWPEGSLGPVVSVLWLTGSRNWAAVHELIEPFEEFRAGVGPP